MRHLIKRSFPAHGVLGEEFGNENLDAEYVWVLDPIDGTRAFISGIPVWGTLIGLMRNGVPVYGMMHQPFTGERFSGDGRQARYEGPNGPRTLRTRQTTELATATLMTTTPACSRARRREAYARVESQVRLAALWLRLLRLLHARRRPCRSRDRERAEALRHRRADPDHRGRRRRRHLMGRRQRCRRRHHHRRRQQGAASGRARLCSPAEAVGACILAGDEGVEGRPELLRGWRRSPSGSRGAPSAAPAPRRS